jgi:RND superfamily putative drug exporter
VFVLSRIAEAHQAGLSNEDAVATGVERTGRLVTAAAMLFSVAVGAFAASELVFVKELSIGLVAAVLVDATIVRALLVPALMRLLGDANWWSPRWCRRLVTQQRRAPRHLASTRS